MFTDAKTVREIANKINENKRKKAKEVVKAEWEEFIIPRITAAAEIGAYSCSYFWAANTLMEQGVDMYNFQEELKNLLALLGYNAEIVTDELMGAIVKITVYINWRN